MGQRLRDLRQKRSISQTELARLVGVTPSTISQVESNSILPSLPALVKMAEILHVDVGAFFQARPDPPKVVFPAGEAVDVKLPQFSEEDILVRALSPADFDPLAEPFLVEIPPGRTLTSHFFVHTGHELGYLVTGGLEMKLGSDTHTLQPGDVVYLTADLPSQWRNTSKAPARLLWLKLKG
jgi:transcriptional regulator with XRE-family HTH domain